MSRIELMYLYSVFMCTVFVGLLSLHVYMVWYVVVCFFMGFLFFHGVCLFTGLSCVTPLFQALRK